ncbi:MAG: hypothetical protein NTU97_00290, partial [Candidatus Magasanikbacteria bacterium]|nr:hypothetical protein [Candidatus Magasanikbacteria bacterium]
MKEKVNYQFFTTTKEAVEAMYEAVSKAQSSIYLETYFFKPFDHSFKLAEKLKQKAQEGLEVKVIFDGFGAKDFDEKIIEDIRKV